MKRFFLTLLATILSATMYGKEIKVNKEGGKPCLTQKSVVCYDRIYTYDGPELHEISCTNPGFEQCSKYAIITVGSYSLDLDSFINEKVEMKILEGITSFNGTIKNEKNIVVAVYNWTGKINTDGIIEYELTINDEL